MTDPVAERNAAIIREYLEVFNGHDVKKGSDYLTADYVNHAAPKAPAGPQGWRLVMGAIFKSFPDFTYTIEEMMADGDKVMVYLTATGTHSGKAWAPPPDARDQSIPSLLAGTEATGRRWTARHFQFFRLVDGKIAEHWSIRDDLAMLQQLDLVRLGAAARPVPEPASA